MTAPPCDTAARFLDLRYLLERDGRVTGPGFEPGPEYLDFLQNDARILVVGAGGLGCELLKDLALSGFGRIDVIDMDTIDVTNLNRQFLFRPRDVGRSKAEVAAARIMERIPGVVVTPHHAAIEDRGLDFYADFHVIVLGLDSLEARRHMNGVACSFLRHGPDGAVDPASIKPLVDGGTQGFQGHARVMYPGVTPCFECTLWLFPPQTKFPLCTIAETPRSPAHCVEYAKLVAWPRARPGEEFDADDEGHMAWVYEAAAARAAAHGIAGVTPAVAAGVVKNIIPAIASTNAAVAAACALETLKAVTNCCAGLDNFFQYNGTDGVYSLRTRYEADPACPVCSPGVALELPAAATLGEALDAIAAAPGLADKALAAPSVSHGARNLYVRGALEAATRANLGVPLAQLVGAATGGEATLTVNDKKLAAPAKVRVRFVGSGEGGAAAMAD